VEQPGHDERPGGGATHVLLKRLRIGESRALLIAVLSQALQYGSGLLMLPFMVTRLSAAEVGIWYIFLTVQGLAMIADFGFQPTLARGFALARSGVETLQAQGVAGAGTGTGASAGNTPNYPLCRQLLTAAGALYLGLALLLLTVLATAGLAYVRHLASRDGLDPSTVSLAWLLFAVAVVLGIYLQWVSPLLIGFGLIEQNYLFLLSMRGSSALLAIGALLGGLGLVGVSAAWLGGAVMAGLFGRLAARPVLDRMPRARPARAMVVAVLRQVAPNAVRMGLIGIASFLILRFSVLAVSTFMGLEAAGRLAISAQILTGVAAIAGLPNTMNLARLVGARVRDDRGELRRIILRNLVFYLACYTAGALALIVLGPLLLRLIGSSMMLLALPALVLLAVVTLLEGFHSNAAFIITTGNTVPFLSAGLISGVAVALGVAAIAWSGGGLILVIAWQGLVQLAYNNWKWPLVVWKEVWR
jgi:O-antigen/teichoic acid export membrane protein